MLNNNLIFSLIVSLMSTTIFYFTKVNKDNNQHEKKQDIIVLFGIIFVSTFVLKMYLSDEKPKVISGENTLSHSTRPPF